ncbi:putative integral membrane protein [Babesia bovis T2Bo]|uniref:Membrane protein, putative n=1 Tax=Babesia bovis TaxID=5865 RepID=A7AP18_BABBO|nr:putative integral membrane protein [Babesia bovis T2Bo]EDO08302.1 putative integral membrane protein [Babesia bovis T2Bo]|eukprot:XP_001611870.1 membrane protein [Babesia bovis T2Bo]
MRTHSRSGILLSRALSAIILLLPTFTSKSKVNADYLRHAKGKGIKIEGLHNEDEGFKRGSTVDVVSNGNKIEQPEECQSNCPPGYCDLKTSIVWGLIQPLSLTYPYVHNVPFSDLQETDESSNKNLEDVIEEADPMEEYAGEQFAGLGIIDAIQRKELYELTGVTAACLKLFGHFYRVSAKGVPVDPKAPIRKYMFLKFIPTDDVTFGRVINWMSICFVSYAFIAMLTFIGTTKKHEEVQKNS